MEGQERPGEQPNEQPKAPDYGNKLKEMQMKFIDKIGSGGLGENDFMALMEMMQKEKPNDSMEMMKSMQMMKMLDQPKDDSGQNMFLMMMMMDGMKQNNGSEVDKKIEKLESLFKESQEDKKYQQVMETLKDMKKDHNSIGIKEILALSQNKDKVISEINQIASQKDRELLMNQFSGQMGALQAEIKNIGSGGDIGKVSQTMKQVKEFYDTMGLGSKPEKSKEEVIKDLIENTAKTFAPAVNNYVENMTRQQPPMTPQQIQQQQQKIQNIRKQQGQAPAQQPASPQQAPASAPQPEQPQTLFGEQVFEDLVNISDKSDIRKGKKA